MKLLKKSAKRRRHTTRQPIQRTRRHYRRHSAVQTPRTRQQESPQRSYRGSAQALGIVFAITFLVWLALFGWLHDRPQLHGDGSPRLQEATLSYMEEVTNFRLSLSERSLANYLQGVLPEYERIDVDVPLLDNTVNITAELKPSAFTWQANGRRYDVSIDGVVLGQQQSEAPEHLSIIDNSSLEYEVGSRVATAEFLRFMDQLDQALTDEYTPVSLRIDGSTQYVVVTLENYPFQLRLSPDIKPSAQVATVKDLIDMLDEQGRAYPQKYVDTRVEGRVFWQ